ncbi:MAG: VCBS repeat-containing protein [Caldilineaceae bacterium]|nr:VCBS repeat-containing protein [Caldilineaceae bacterium]
MIVTTLTGGGRIRHTAPEPVRVLVPVVITVLMLLVLVSQTAAAQDAPDARPSMPHHEPGHVLGVSDLDVRLALNEVADPLAANTTLLSTDKIMLAWHSPRPTPFCNKMYDVDSDLGTPIPGALTCDDFGGMQSGNNVDVAAGRLLSAAGWEDAVLVTDYETNKLYASLKTYNSAMAQQQVINTYINSAPVDGVTYDTGLPYGGAISVATGDFDNDGWDEFVVGWESTAARYQMQWFKPQHDYWNTVQFMGLLSPGTLGGYKFLDVAAGDFNADGRDEIVTAWANNSDKLVVGLYSVNADGTWVLHTQLVEAVKPGRIVTTVGDFNADGIDEFAVGFNTPTTSNLYVYQAAKDLTTLTRKSAISVDSANGQSMVWEMAGRSLGLAAGDFNGDGDDELAFMHPFNMPSSQIGALTIYDDVNATLAVTETVNGRSSAWPAYGTVILDAGDLNGDTIEEIVLTSIDDGHTNVNIFIGIVQVSPDLREFAEKGSLLGEQTVLLRTSLSNSLGRLSMALGAYNGETVRVGPPTYRRQSQTVQNIALIHAPPKHHDVIEIAGTPTAVDINVTDRCIPPTGPPCTYTKYETEQKTTTSMSLTTSRDWSVSADAELKIPHLKVSMAATYGESFEKTTTSFKSVAFGQDVEADTDDVIVRLQQDLDIWEYPVYADGSDVIEGYILVVWPVKADPLCTGECPAALTTRIDAMDSQSVYAPNHEFGNVLSYSPLPPDNIKSTIKSDYVDNLGTNYTETWLKWSDVEESEEKQSSKLDLNASLTVSGWGQSLTTSGSYSEGDVSVNKVGFESSTEIHIYFFSIEQQYSYSVRPFIYWAEPDGSLVVDYSVTLPSDPNRWWVQTYNKPDPTFNLPWKDGKLGDYYRQFTREITLTPLQAAPGEDVVVAAKVRNYSPVGVFNVPVHFYLGDPQAGGTKIGEATVASILPMGHSTVSTSFNTAGHADGETLKVYAVIDPENTIAEMHEEYNTGFAVLPIKADVAQTSGSRTLSLHAEDIVVDPAAPAPTGTVNVTATVHATNGTFTFVGVDFWDGMPLRGGRLIGSRVIPVIAGEQGETVTVQWSTEDARGVHEIWVTLLYNPDDQIVSDNYAYKPVEFAPYHIYMPAVLGQ